MKELNHRRRLGVELGSIERNRRILRPIQQPAGNANPVNTSVNPMLRNDFAQLVMAIIPALVNIPRLPDVDDASLSIQHSVDAADFG